MATESKAGIVELATVEEVTVGTDSTKAVTPAGVKEATSLTLPTGTIIAFAGIATPVGFLSLNGATGLSRTAYASLFEVIKDWNLYNAEFEVIGTVETSGDGATTFDLPNANDMYLGGSGTYGVGVAQGDAIRNIRGSTYVVDNNIDNIASRNPAGCFVLPPSTTMKTSTNNHRNILDTFGISFDASNVVPTAEENRPKTLRINWIIKY